jgi:nitrogen fixation protein NifX
MSQPFSNEVALRIGLAVRLLPGISARDLIEAIQMKLGDNIDEKGLGTITVGHLKAAFGQSEDLDGDEEAERDTRAEDMAAFKEAVRVLWGDTSQQALPQLEPCAPEDMLGSVRVAFASNSGEELNGHFGSCERFLVYQVSRGEMRLVGVRDTAGAETSDDKNGFRVGLIKDCKILYVVHVGGPASAKVIKADIHLISVPEGGAARTILKQLQQVLAGSPPPWLAKALGIAPAVRGVSYATR